MTKTIMMIAGVVFIILGLIGFVNNPIFGIFGVDAIHNLIHIVAGVLAIVFASKGEAQARTGAMILGVVLAIVTILGFLVGDGKILGFIATNVASNWLHLVATVVLLILGFMKSGSTSASSTM